MLQEGVETRKTVEMTINKCFYFVVEKSGWINRGVAYIEVQKAEPLLSRFLTLDSIIITYNKVMIDIKCVPVSKLEKKASNAFLNFLRKNDEGGLKQRMYMFHLWKAFY